MSNNNPSIAQVAAMCIPHLCGYDGPTDTAKAAWEYARAWHAAGVECGELKAEDSPDDPVIAYCEVCCSHQPQLLHHDKTEGCRMECARCAAAKGGA